MLLSSLSVPTILIAFNSARIDDIRYDCWQFMSTDSSLSSHAFFYVASRGGWSGSLRARGCRWTRFVARCLGLVARQGTRWLVSWMCLDACFDGFSWRYLWSSMVIYGHLWCFYVHTYHANVSYCAFGHHQKRLCLVFFIHLVVTVSWLMSWYPPLQTWLQAAKQPTRPVNLRVLWYAPHNHAHDHKDEQDVAIDAQTGTATISVIRGGDEEVFREVHRAYLEAKGTYMSWCSIDISCVSTNGCYCNGTCI